MDSCNWEHLVKQSVECGGKMYAGGIGTGGGSQYHDSATDRNDRMPVVVNYYWDLE